MISERKLPFYNSTISITAKNLAQAHTHLFCFFDQRTRNSSTTISAKISILQFYDFHNLKLDDLPLKTTLCQTGPYTTGCQNGSSSSSKLFSVPVGELIGRPTTGAAGHINTQKRWHKFQHAPIHIWATGYISISDGQFPPPRDRRQNTTRAGRVSCRPAGYTAAIVSVANFSRVEAWRQRYSVGGTSCRFLSLVLLSGPLRHLCSPVSYEPARQMHVFAWLPVR